MGQNVDSMDEVDVESFIETVSDVTPLSDRQAQIYVLRQAGFSVSDVQDFLSVDEGEDVEKRTIQNHKYTADSRLANRINMLALDIPYLDNHNPGVIVEDLEYTRDGLTSMYYLIKQIPDIELVGNGEISGEDWQYAVIRQKETGDGFSVDYEEFRDITEFKSQIYESKTTDFLNILSSVKLYESYTGEELSWGMINFQTALNFREVEQAFKDGFLDSQELEKVLTSYNSSYSGDVLIGTYPNSKIGVGFEDVFNQPIVISGDIGAGKTVTSKIISKRLLSTDSTANVIRVDFLEQNGYLDEYTTDNSVSSLSSGSRFNHLPTTSDTDVTDVIEELMEYIQQTEFSEENKLLLVLDETHYLFDKDEEKMIELYNLVQDMSYVGILMTTQTMDIFKDNDSKFSENVYDNGSFIVHRMSSISSDVAEKLGMNEAIKEEVKTVKVGQTKDFAGAVVREKPTDSWKPIEVNLVLSN